jgi:hypothetical protein
MPGPANPVIRWFSCCDFKRPTCPKCEAQMMLARIVPAFLGTDLRTFECTMCNYVLKTLGAYRDP